jgi:hypothetical protein
MSNNIHLAVRISTRPLFYLTTDSCHFPLLFYRVWSVRWLGYVHKKSETTGCGSRQLSGKIMTLEADREHVIAKLKHYNISSNILSTAVYSFELTLLFWTSTKSACYQPAYTDSLEKVVSSRVRNAHSHGGRPACLRLVVSFTFRRLYPVHSRLNTVAKR